MSEGSARARSFLEAIAGFTDEPEAVTPSQDRPHRLATVDALYTTGDPKVLFDGESLMGVRSYKALVPVAPSQRVVMAPVGNTYVILGAVPEGKPSRVPGVVPSSVVVGSGSATVDSFGLVTFTGASSVSLNGVFNGLDGDSYEVSGYGLTTNGTVVALRLRQAGVDISTTTYDRSAMFTLLAAGPTASGAAGSAYLTYFNPTASGGALAFAGKTRLVRPAVNALTEAITESGSTTSGNRYNWREFATADASVCDGLSLIAAAGGGVTMTGWLKVVKTT